MAKKYTRSRNFDQDRSTGYNALVETSKHRGVPVARIVPAVSQNERRFADDSHVFFWMFLYPSKLKPKVWSVLKDGSNTLYLSAASAWEMRSDPFDRMLIAQAQLENSTIVTADRAFSAYAVKCMMV